MPDHSWKEPEWSKAKTTPKLGGTPKGDVLGQVMGRLADDGDVHEVVEQLEEADRSTGDRLAVCSRRAPQPLCEAAASPVVGHGLNVRAGARPGDLHPETPRDRPVARSQRGKNRADGQ